MKTRIHSLIILIISLALFASCGSVKMLPDGSKVWSDAKENLTLRPDGVLEIDEHDSWAYHRKVTPEDDVYVLDNDSPVELESHNPVKKFDFYDTGTVKGRLVGENTIILTRTRPFHTNNYIVITDIYGKRKIYTISPVKTDKH